MPAYPTCIICHGTESELDLSGVCTTCLSRGSGKEPRITKGTKSTIPPGVRTIVENETKTVDSSPVDSATATLVKPEKSSPPVNLPTVRFTNYTNLEYIDRGGMGVVYKALQVNADRIVALKIMNAVAQSDSRQERRFKTEGQALARLSHPGIVQIYDVDEEQGLPYFSMEYVPGGSLAKRMRSGKPLSHREAAEMVAGVASALAAAHAQKIVHRDIKPSNILLTEIGKPKVTDFGLAAFFDQSARMTTTGAMLGTPAYMSPEQAAGKYGEVGPLSDVYSIGATLYELLTGRPPFSASTPMATAIKVCNERVIRPRAINPTIPADLEAICLKCLEKDPRDRYPSAAALANDLTRYLRGEPVGKATFSQKLKRSIRQNRKLISAMLLVIFFAIAFAFLRDRAPAKIDPAIIPTAEEQREQAKQEIEKNLKDGKPVELVGPTGMPRYFNRYFGDAKLDVRNYPGGDQSAWFDATNTTCFDLCDDTQTDHYLIEAQIQHVENRALEGRVGLFLRGRNQTDVIRWSVVMFSDFYVAPEQAPATVRDLGLRVQDRICVTFPTIYHINGNENSKRHQFKAANLHENPWRTIQIEVNKGGIEGYWEVDGHTTPVIQKTVKQFYESDQELQRLLNAYSPKRVVPAWQPRSAVGIFAEKATVAFKNFKITQLP